MGKLYTIIIKKYYLNNLKCYYNYKPENYTFIIIIFLIFNKIPYLTGLSR